MSYPLNSFTLYLPYAWTHYAEWSGTLDLEGPGRPMDDQVGPWVTEVALIGRTHQRVTRSALG